jgi:hypothetical protein
MRLVLTAMLVLSMSSALAQTPREARTCGFSSGFRCADGLRFERRKCHCVEIIQSTRACRLMCLIDGPGKDCRPCP